MDGGNGQLFEFTTDLLLRGPLRMGFGRYYASRMSAAGYVTPLGLNWMSPYDMALRVNGTSVQVMMFPAKVVTFTNGTSGWQLSTTSFRDVAYQFAAAATGYQLMDPTTKLVYTFNQSGALTRIANRSLRPEFGNSLQGFSSYPRSSAAVKF